MPQEERPCETIGTTPKCARSSLSEGGRTWFNKAGVLLFVDAFVQEYNAFKQSTLTTKVEATVALASVRE